MGKRLTRTYLQKLRREREVYEIDFTGPAETPRLADGETISAPGVKVLNADDETDVTAEFTDATSPSVVDDVKVRFWLPGAEASEQDAGDYYVLVYATTSTGRVIEDDSALLQVREDRST